MPRVDAMVVDALRRGEPRRSPPGEQPCPGRPPTLRAVWVLLVFSLAAPFAHAATAPRVVVNEIMYHPPGTNTLEQWIELRNDGNTAVDLSGWRLSDAIEFTFPQGASMAAGGLAVVAADPAAFRSRHPAASPIPGAWRGRLSADSDRIRLLDATGRTVSSVTYASSGDWAVRRLGAPDRLNRRGWEWYAEHDGLGRSLERVSPGMPADAGQNWAASRVDGGTPGEANSVIDALVAPLILDVTHTPAIPSPSDPVAITARLVTESGRSGLTGVLQWRRDGDPTFVEAPLRDDGAHGDALPGDGLFGAVIPPQAEGTVVEFRLRARDSAGVERAHPAVLAPDADRKADLVYQVEASATIGRQPVLRLVATRTEYEYLTREIWGGQPYSDAAISGTFIARGSEGLPEVRYSCGFRNRGHGTRNAVPHNFHVSFPADRPWDGRESINLNTHYTHSQHLGSAAFRSAGIPAPESRPVQVRVNGLNLAKPGQEQFGSYAANEPVNARFPSRQFPQDGDGNLYRGVRDRIPGIRADADLTWKGPDPAAYTNAYAKETHGDLDDWSDFLRLLEVLNHEPDGTFAAALREVADVDQWMRYFAANTLLDNQENSLANGAGDDFMLYRGVADPRFRLLPYDLDSLIGRGLSSVSPGGSIWRMTNLTVINRVMKSPALVPAYFREIESLAATIFAPERMNALIENLLSPYVEAGTIARLKDYHASHVRAVLAQVPRQLTVTTTLPMAAGHPTTTEDHVTLEGAAPATRTRFVRVNGREAEWVAWRGAWRLDNVPLHPGLNRLVVQALDSSGTEFQRLHLDVVRDDGSMREVSGIIASDTRWPASDGPYQVTTDLVVGPGATLTLEPGTTVYLGPGVDLRVASGGRLAAAGTEAAPIRFSALPGTTESWGGIVIEGGAGSPETHIAHAHVERNGSVAIHVDGGTVLLEHLTFGATDRQYLSLDAASFLVRECIFPSGITAFELTHGSDGIKAGGRGIFLRNYFGATLGYSDVLDFTGGNRPGQPILHFIDNVCMGSADDILDLDGTDAWVEGNIFLHVHRNGSPDSASAVSGGSDGGRTSEVTVIGNIFFDVDHAVTAKQGNYYTLFHNTIVRQTHEGGLDVEGAVANFSDEGTTEGAGLYAEGNIIADARQLLRGGTNAQVLFTRNLMRFPVPRQGNIQAEPRLVHLPSLDETRFTSWGEAQILRTWLAPVPGSPGSGGTAFRPLGAVVPRGVFLELGLEAGMPTTDTTATFRVTPFRHGSMLPAGFPEGSGYTHYRYRLDEGPWSAEMPSSTLIVVSNLADGTHSLEVLGRLDSRLEEDVPELGADPRPARRTWIVDSSHVAPNPIRLNEIVAATTEFDTRDKIELVNHGPDVVDLGGFSLTDDPAQPRRFVFPAGTRIEPGWFLVVVADTAPSAGGELHTGFALDAEGGTVQLHAPGTSAIRLDAVTYGLQVAGFSIGRQTDGNWGLCQPSPALPNLAQPLGDPTRLRINEWLADARFTAPADFVEVCNPDPLPVALGGLGLTDAAGDPFRHRVAPLSFVAGQGFAHFWADGAPDHDARRLGFRLAPEVGLIALSSEQRGLLDVVHYAASRTDVAEGRSPNGGNAFAQFMVPTPGAPNPGGGEDEVTVSTVRVPLLSLGAPWKHSFANLDDLPWAAPAFDDAGWAEGPALLGFEDATLPAPGLQTPLASGRITYYFRTRLLVETNLPWTTLNLTAVVDDGVVLYLDGTPLWTNGMPSGAPRNDTFASRNVGNATTTTVTLPAPSLAPGWHVLAAEVHQVNAGSSDLVWGLALEAAATVTNRIPSTVPAVQLAEISAAGDADFVELFNASESPAPLEGLSLTDDLDLPRRWSFPADAVLAAGARLVVACDPMTAPGATNTGFGLSSSGGLVLLFDRPDTGAALLDALRYGIQAPGYSLGRIPDKDGDWTLNHPSPGRPNEAVTLGPVSAIRVNEWMADPETGADWFELFNVAPAPVALGGLFLTDDLLQRARSPMPALSYLAPGAHGFLRLIADGAPFQGGNHVAFSLSRDGEFLGLFDPTGLLLDGIAFGPQRAGISQGRYPDGSPDIRNFPGTASPGGPNRIGEPADLDTDADGLPDAWEMIHFRSLARDGRDDFDGDGMSDRDEYIAGTGPASAADALRILAVEADAGVRIRFSSVPGRSYRMLHREALDRGPWQVLVERAAEPAGTATSVEDPGPFGATRYYRIEVLPRN